MRRVGRWAAAVVTVLASALVNAISAGTAFAAGAPPYAGPRPEGGKGIDRGAMLYQGPTDWTVAIVLVAGLLAIGVILALVNPTRQRNARPVGTVTPTVPR